MPLEWMHYGSAFALNKKPGWNGFMTNSTDDSRTCVSSRVITVPFINLEAGSLTSIYSALSFACDQSSIHNQLCIITFDQLLYMKARAIIAAEPECSELKSTIVRLGGFHLLISYLCTIGNIMEGSGLEARWQTVYRKLTISHIMTGHAYARAVRAHMLTYQALVAILVERSPNVKETITAELMQLYSDVLNKNTTPTKASN